MTTPAAVVESRWDADWPHTNNVSSLPRGGRGRPQWGCGQPAGMAGRTGCTRTKKHMSGKNTINARRFLLRIQRSNYIDEIEFVIY